MNPRHERYHPKWYRRRVPIFWWLRNFAYTRFISRELTCVFVAYAAVLLLVQVWVASRGPEAYETLMSWLRYPPVLVFHVVVLLALLFHAITWLNLTPKALVLRLRGRRVPDAAILLAHYGAWLAASALVFWGLVGI